MPKKPTNTIPLNTNTEHMLIGAVRYALGRRTYIVGITVSYMIPLLPRLSDWCLVIMERDLSEAFSMYERTHGEYGLGDACDVHDWQKFSAALHAEINGRTDFDVGRRQNG